MIKMYKRNYHPLIPLFYSKGMLSKQQLDEIPKRTLQHWSKNKNQQYHFDTWVQPFTNHLEDIQKTYERTHLKKMMQFMIKMSNGYQRVLSDVTCTKKILKENAAPIINSIDAIISLSKINVKRACKFYGVSSDWYYREKRKINCSLNIFNKCFKQHPNQLTFKETNAIERIVKDPRHFGKTKVTLYYYALRNELVSCAKSTFSKYAKALGYKKPKKPKIPPRIGVRATRIFEWLHVDITLVPTLEEGMQKVAFVKDNFSKAILHYASVSEKADSKFITKLFKEAFEKHNLSNANMPIKILTDGGSENKGAFTTWVNHFNAPPIVTKITARTVDFPLSNSMAESTHSIYKTEFLKGQISRTTKNHLDSLERFVDYYNLQRFPADLCGLHPIEVINGKLPDKDYFKNQISEAKTNRIATNKAFNKCALIR
jgi:transposase InsO family protein